MDTLHEVQYICFIISRSVLLRARNISSKNCRENENTHFMLKNFFENLTVVEKCCITGQTTGDNTLRTYCMLDT